MRSTAIGLMLTGMLSSAAWGQALDTSATVSGFMALRAAPAPAEPVHWLQPQNRKERCEVMFWGDGPLATDVKWFGDCKDGKARGLGVSVVHYASPASTVVGLEEYVGSTAADVVQYRLVAQRSDQNMVLKGRMTPTDKAYQLLWSGKSPRGNATVALSQALCRSGECVNRRADPSTGSVFYDLGGKDYRVGWEQQRADNQFLYERRAVMIKDAIPLEKWLFDGGVYDLAHDLRSGQTSRVTFALDANTVLALPFERFSDASAEIDAAITAADAKLAEAHKRFCVGQKNADIRMLCDPSSLIPVDAALAASRDEANEAARTVYANLQANAASANASAAQAAQAEAYQRQQQELAAMQRRQADEEALQRGFEALRQVGQQTPPTIYPAPQVQQPVLSQPPIVHCRTIGYITTCN